MKRYIIMAMAFIVFTQAKAQSILKLKFTDASTQQAIPSVTIAEKNKIILVADNSGLATLSLANGKHTLIFSSVNYETKTATFTLPDTVLHEIILSPLQKIMEEVTVSSTRNNQKIENSPLKVEVLGREEMDEENTIKPANIASILGDISGIQIQQSSAVSGNANVRIQGLEGRYTQILKDGMPLYDGFSGGFGILSIPPLDLKQVELIKGSASTLYGGGAIGGLVNIISRKPNAKQEAVVTLNHSTLKESNINTFFSKRYQHFGYTFFGGYTHQKAVDVNKDGFSDVPDLNTFIVHPRLFFYPDDKTTITTGYTGTFEKRNGGDMLVLQNKADAVHQYFEKNKTERHSGEFLIDRNLNGNKKLSFKSSLSSFNRNILTNSHNFNGNQMDYFTELSLLIPYNQNSFVGGINVTGDRFKKLLSDPILLNDFSNNTIGAFVQNTWLIKEKTSIEAGLRDDYHNKYGNFLLPRLAFFHRFNEHWGARAGVGMGYKIPNPLATQIIEYDIEKIQPLSSNIKAEKSIGYSAEGNYKKVWDNGNEFFINHAFFLTKISDPIIITETSNGEAAFTNAAKPVVTKGFDTYIKATVHHWELYAGYTYTFTQRKYLQQNQFMPLTPKNRMAFTIVRDFDEAGFRIGLEGSYNGPQYRLDVTQTPGYFFGAAMVEKRFGEHFSVVLNCENLFDYRQSKIESLYTGSITNPKFQPLWAPIDGRVINLSVRIKPF